MMRHAYVGPPKPFCPCDAGMPQDCKPEQWRPAHSMPDCEQCGKPIYYNHARPRTRDDQPDSVIA
jgi:hypothetical protein